MEWPKIKLIPILLLVGLMACQNEEVGPQSTIDEGSGVFAYNNGLLIVNEGTFNFSNASVSYYQPENGISVSQVFDRQNDLPLGDVLQSIYLDEEDLYLVVNNSSRIAVVDPVDFRLRRDFFNMGSPRYLVRYENRLFISQLFDSHIWVVDALSGELIEKWPTPGWTERVLLTDTLLWVECYSSQELLPYDLKNDSALAPIPISGGPNSTLVANGKMYGLIAMAVGSMLFEVDPSTQERTRELNLAPFDAMHLQFDSFSGKLYFWSGGGVFRININDWALETDTLFSTGNKNVGGLYLDPLDRNWYYTDVLDFASQGWLYRVDENYTHIQDSVRMGFIPRTILRP